MAFLFYFGSMNFICFNGKTLPEDERILLAGNRGYRYGDGLFETMKLANGRIILEDYHFERLEAGMQLLQFNKPALFNKENIREEIIGLSRKNNCEKLARIRLSVSRGNGGLYDSDDRFQYLIECWSLNSSLNKLNENGLVIDVFPDARKGCDLFSNLKTANYLPYVMASIWAKKNKLNDALLLNTHERICDATLANIFWIKNESIFTPPLSEGCVAGVMRRYLLENLQSSGFQVKEQKLETTDLEDANEVFLTNAIRDIRWVKQFRNKIYGNTLSPEIFNKHLKAFF